MHFRKCSTFACCCWIYRSERTGFCNSVTRFDWIWKQFENNFKNVDRSVDVLNMENHCCCGNCAVTRWNSCSTNIGPLASSGTSGNDYCESQSGGWSEQGMWMIEHVPFDSMHWAKKSNICCVATVSIDGCGRCRRSDRGTSCKLSQPTRTTHSSIISNVSVCLLRNSVNSFMCCPAY